MKDQEIAMGRLGDEYKGGIYQNVTICVTEDCNLRCKYCYVLIGLHQQTTKYMESPKNGTLSMVT